MRTELLEEHARVIGGLPDVWKAYRFDGRWHGYYELKGAIVPLLTRGKNKGRPNWRKVGKDWPATTIKIGHALHEDWLKSWEQRIGKCCKCIGEGKTLKYANVSGERTYRDCKACEGTGKARAMAEAEE